MLGTVPSSDVTEGYISRGVGKRESLSESLLGNVLMIGFLSNLLMILVRIRILGFSGVDHGRGNPEFDKLVCSRISRRVVYLNH